jgi:hypothetical protein
MQLLADVIGTVGVAMILLAYFLVQTGRKTAQDLIYPMLNLIGALLLLLSLMVNWNTPSVIIEIFWIAISVYGIAKILRSR